MYEAITTINVVFILRFNGNALFTESPPSNASSDNTKKEEII